MVGSGSSGGGGEEGFTGRVTIGCDHSYDGEIFDLGLALDQSMSCFAELLLQVCVGFTDLKEC
jgi:hypothetical protein